MTNLMHNYVILNIYFYNPVHVSSNIVLIIERLNCINPLKAELNPMCHLLALLEADHILHVIRIRVNTASVIVLSVSDRSCAHRTVTY